MKPRPNSYSALQVGLHWAVVVGVVFQIAFHDPAVRAMEALRSGEVPRASDTIWLTAHVASGMTVGAAIILRLALRAWHGTPDHPSTTSPLMSRLADLMHYWLYIALTALVASGVITRFTTVNLDQLHWLLAMLLVLSVLGHAAAAVFNQFVRKDGTLSRMIPVLIKTRRK